jgi:hypothetical protein
MLLLSSDALFNNPTKRGWAIDKLRATIGVKSSEVIIREAVTSLIKGNKT